MDPHLEQELSDRVVCEVANSVKALLDKAESKAEQLAILKVVANTSMLGVSEMTNPAAASIWLRGCVDFFDRQDRERRGGLN